MMPRERTSICPFRSICGHHSTHRHACLVATCRAHFLIWSIRERKRSSIGERLVLLYPQWLTMCFHDRIVPLKQAAKPIEIAIPRSVARPALTASIGSGIDITVLPTM
jgi:hypothetical protein